MLLRLLLVICACLLAGAAGRADAGPDAGGQSRAAVFKEVKALAALGRGLFFDPALSASGKLACASCHDPAHAYGPPNALAVQLGGKDGRDPGLRAVPSLRYLQVVPQFTEHYYESEDEGDSSVDNGPTGGLTWDGRVDRGRDQAQLPLLSPFEMANESPAAVVAAVRRSPYGAALRALTAGDPPPPGADDTAHDFDVILEAFEAFEQDYTQFYPYSSKYDAYLAGKATLSPAEARGLALFNDPAKGNCAHCHVSQRGNDGTPPQFTDYGYVALGVPRNPDIPANSDPAWYDLGLCGPLRQDLAAHPDYCGLFIAPSLRNVATRHSFFHNGVFHRLADAVAFYATRDSDPGRWYPRGADGRVRKYDDLPAAYRDNVNDEPPFGLHPGDPPALTDAEIADIVAFLGTLTDGYRANDKRARR
ncbi:MAG TPA: cytochrome c peroxidase [Stellaceae bacterium]|nr:cytochrome c peroxidase [Stellaceae bacterium]